MRQSTRLVVNTLATYSRMLLTVGVGLVFTKLAYSGLGKENFGLWSLAVASASWFLIGSDAAASAVERFLAYEIGKAEGQAVRQTFATSLAICMAVGLVIIAICAAAVWAMPPILKIPPESHNEMILIIALTSVGLSATIALSPYKALFFAHQEVFLLSAIEVSEALTRLLCIVIAIQFTEDRVLWLCALLVASQLLIGLVSIVLCTRRYPESRTSPLAARRDIAAQMWGFSFWSVVGSLAYRVRMAGPPTLLSGVFGPVHNAAFAIANQAAGYQSQVAAALARATRPAVTQAAGAKNQVLANRISMLSSKYGTCMMMLILVPVVCEPDLVLRYWIGPDRPANAALFMQLLCVSTIFPWLIMSHYHSVNASGKIRFYMILSMVAETAGLAASFALAMTTRRPEMVLWTALGTSAAFTAIVVALIGPRIGLTPRQWFTDVLVPVLLTAAPPLLFAVGLRYVLEPNLLRLIVSGAASAMLIMGSLWAVGLTTDERAHFRRIAHAWMHRLRPRRAEAIPDKTPASGQA